MARNPLQRPSYVDTLKDQLSMANNGFYYVASLIDQQEEKEEEEQ